MKKGVKQIMELLPEMTQENEGRVDLNTTLEQPQIEIVVLSFGEFVSNLKGVDLLLASAMKKGFSSKKMALSVWQSELKEFGTHTV